MKKQENKKNLNTPSSEKLSKKIFIGIFLDAEKRILLSQNEIWKESKMMPKLSDKTLSEVHFHGKEYLGIHLPDQISLKDLLEIKCEIQQQIEQLLPASSVLQFFTFPQFFIQ